MTEGSRLRGVSKGRLECPAVPPLPGWGGGWAERGAWLLGPCEEELTHLLLPLGQVGGGARLAEGPWATFCHQRPGIWLWELRLTLHC